MAIIPTLLGHSLFNWSVKWISTSIISMAILLEPVGATILAFYLLGEKIYWTQVLGGFIVIGSLTLFLVDGKKIRMKKKLITHETN